jgi:Protein of unknown function (DUF3570)
MKKVYLSVIGFALLCRLSTQAQTRPDTAKLAPLNGIHAPVTPEKIAGGGYDPRDLSIEEINLVSSYYSQNGDHSAVTGGIGTERVTDIANSIDLKLTWVGEGQRQNTLAIGLGYDHHTSASAAFVNTSGASKTGGSRIYPSVDWMAENKNKGTSFGIGTYYSGEYNYTSLGADVHFSLKTHDRDGEFTAKFQGYFDQVTLIYPSEFIPQPVVSSGVVITTASGNSVSGGGSGGGKANIPSSPRNTYTASFGYSQIVNSRMQIAFLGDVVTQNGYLGLPFHRVYFSTGKDTIEKLPSSRFKLPLGVRLNYFVGDDIILRSYYRYYMDNWGTRANTANLEIAYKISPFFSISPFYRFYAQTAAKYFAPFEVHKPTDEYYTSNYEYAQFQSSFYGIGFRLVPPTGVFGWQNLHDMEIRYGHYSQTTDLVSDVISVSLGFK